jgi:hypothetical protein
VSRDHKRGALGEPAAQRRALDGERAGHWTRIGRATRVQRNPRNATSDDRDLPGGETADPGFPRSAAIGFDSSQLEGLAVAIPWGFESPLPHHSTLLSARLRRAERLAHGEPSIMSNVLSERFASRRLAKCESRDGCRLTTTMASSSSDALRLFASLRRQQSVRRRNFRHPDPRATSQRRTGRQLHSQEATGIHRLRRAVQFETARPSARTADQALEFEKEGTARPPRRSRSVRHQPKSTNPNGFFVERLADPAATTGMNLTDATF